MSSALPKEQQTAFQRWEMTSFGDARPAQIERATQAAKISQAEIAAIKEQARNEAYTAAYKEAYALGYQEGQQAGTVEMQAQLRQSMQTLDVLKTNFKHQLAQAHNDIGQDLIALAIDLAGSMTRYQFEHHSESIMGIVKDAIDMLPAIHQPAQIFFHPEDLQLIKNLMGDELEKDGWRLIQDIHLTRGGCRIETAQNLIDATYETRWARLTDALSNSSGDNLSL